MIKRILIGEEEGMKVQKDGLRSFDKLRNLSAQPPLLFGVYIVQVTEAELIPEEGTKTKSMPKVTERSRSATPHPP